MSLGAYEALREIAAESRKPIARCLDELVHEAYRRRLWARYAAANRRLEADPVELEAHRDEEALWAASDTDGLDPSDGTPIEEAREDAASW